MSLTFRANPSIRYSLRRSSNAQEMRSRTVRGGGALFEGKRDTGEFKKDLKKAFLLVAIAFGLTALCYAQTAQVYPVTYDSGAAGGGSTISSTAAIPAAKWPVAFRRVAVGVKASPLGFGLEVATPLTSRLDLRIADNLFIHRNTFTYDGVNLDSKLSLSSMQAGIDIFPFRHSGWHVTPGVLFANHNRAIADASVPGGESFSPGDGNYISSPADPVKGTLRIPLDSTAPTLSIGIGSLFPRSGRHWSIPFEVGVAYIGPPQVGLNLGGSVCDPASGVCQPIANDPQAQANVALEAKQIKSDLSPLKTYPILSVGFSYNFGAGRR